jgi:hypothetical protein
MHKAVSVALDVVPPGPPSAAQLGSDRERLMPTNRFYLQKPVSLLGSCVYTPLVFMCDGLRPGTCVELGETRMIDTRGAPVMQ